jgi:phosphoribosylglycinamide formyltransferase-1
MSVRFAVLLSGSGTNLASLIDAAAAPTSQAEIAVVLSNKADAYGLQRARDASIPAVHISHRGKERSTFDADVVEALRSHDVEWVLLAGFMRILTPVFLDAFPYRVINIHPGLLPSFPGVRAQEQAFDAGVRIAGATVHFVDAGMDSGPVIAQGAVPVMEGDDAEALQQRILLVEHRLFPMVMHWAAEERLTVKDRHVCVDLKPGEQRYLWGG